MLVYIFYDISDGKKSILPLCRKYLKHIQKSVLVGELTEYQLKTLKGKIEKLINIETDKVHIIAIDNKKYIKQYEIGLPPEDSQFI